jgi:hypothetical protein
MLKKPDKKSKYNTQFSLGIVTQSPTRTWYRCILQPAGEQGESPINRAFFNSLMVRAWFCQGMHAGTLSLKLRTHKEYDLNLQ